MLNRCVVICLLVLVFSLVKPNGQVFAEAAYPAGHRPLGQLVISRPRVGSLFQLKGLKGEGYYQTLNADGELCQAEVSLVAGSFTGESLGFGTAAEVVIDVYSPEVSQRLLRTEEVVSEDYSIAYRADTRADMVVLSGLDESAGFILQPQPRWRSWWRVENKGGHCVPVNA